jgi:Uma2 family endonuclease
MLEFGDGEIVAMAGGPPAHGELGVSIGAVLRNTFAGVCRVYSSDVKVRIEATDLSTFPDISVVCGEQQTSAIDKNALVNPTLLVEVTSRTTEDYDRGEKLSHYKQLPSLSAVLFVSHRRPQITVVARSGDGWNVREFRAGESVTLSEPAVSFDVDDVYRGVALEVD